MQAILSQFSKSSASTDDEDKDKDEDEDDVCDDDEEEDNDMEREEATEDEDHKLEVNNDKIDLLVESSDAALIKEVIDELAMEVLTREDINLGCNTILKVSSSFHVLFLEYLTR